MTQLAGKRKNKRLIAILSLAVCGMFGFGYALVPLYDLFCEITGIGGKPTVSASYDPAQITVEKTDRDVWVEFTGNSTNGLPWTIKPQIKKAKLKVGEVYEFNYDVSNNSDRDFVAHAIPSVAPMKSARHLVKLQCFCFDQQTMAARESRQMQVVFYIDPELAKDTATLTLSYSFFEVREPEKSTS